MKLLPGGQVSHDEAGEIAVIVLGPGLPGNHSWTLPTSPASDQELVVTCELTFHGYFAATDGRKPDGTPREAHMGFMLRSSLDAIPAGPYRGHGPIFGRVWQDAGSRPPKAAGAAPPGPRGQLETWGAGVVPEDFEYLRRGSYTPVLRDGVPYKLCTSSKRFQGEVFCRYFMTELGSGGQYQLLFDSGDVQDNNWALNRFNETLTLFDTGGAPQHDYRIRVGNLQAFQRPATGLQTDMRAMPWSR